MENPFDIEQVRIKYLNELHQRTLMLNQSINRSKNGQERKKFLQELDDLVGEQYEAALVIRKIAHRAIQYLSQNQKNGDEAISEKNRDKMLESASKHAEEYFEREEEIKLYALMGINMSDNDETRKLLGPNSKTLTELIKETQNNFKKITPSNAYVVLLTGFEHVERVVIDIARRVYDKGQE